MTATATRTAAEALADVLARENALLAAVDLAGAARMVQEKHAAAEAFAQASKVSPPERDAAARRLAHRLRALADENRALLERAIDVQRRVIGTIARAATVPSPSHRYGATGAATASRKVVPVALLARA
ncbi:MAG TPA: hypothetical protein VHS58_03155 [Acetobacteraceae bacterium]|jgi:hypothetical protein|nr:hypothetical protein [Acetobacteraceae bacterium]